MKNRYVHWGIVTFLLGLVMWALLSRVLTAAPARLRVSPAPGSERVWLGTAIRVDFDQPMDRATVEAAFGLEPATAGQFVWRQDAGGNAVEFQPTDLLSPNMTYKVTLGSGMRTLGGEQLLATDFTWQFATGAAANSITFGSGLPVQIVDPGVLRSGRNSVRIWAGYPRMTLGFALYALSTPEFVKRFGALRSWTIDPIDVNGLNQVAAWQQSFGGGDLSAWETKLPDVPSGFYALIATHPHDGQAGLYVVVSPHVLALKRTAEQRISAWALSLQSQTPIATMQVTLYDAEGRALGAADTDTDGWAELPASAGQPRVAVGQVEDQVTLAGLDGSWQSSGGYWYWWGDVTPWQPDPQRVYLYTDRPIYRPGQDVHFAAILRRQTNEGYTLLDAATPITATLMDARNNVVGQLPVTLDDFGAVHGVFALAAEPSLGVYRLSLTVGERSYTQTFEVDAYRKPEYQVTVTANMPFAIAGDAIEVMVAADYYFGQPVANAQVRLKIYRQETYGYWYSPGPGVLLEERIGVTGSDGRWRTNVTTALQNRADARYFFIAEVADASGQIVSGQLPTPAYWNTFRVALSTDRYGYQRGETVRVLVTARYHDDAPAAGKSMQVTLRRGYRDGEPVVAEQTTITNGQGEAVVEFTDLPQGWYRIVATGADDRDRRYESAAYIWVFEPGGGWWWERTGQMTLSADRTSYQSGDVARLLIESPYTGQGLLTIERAGIYHEQVIEIAGPMTVVELPITAAFAPNVFAKVHLFTTEVTENPYQSTTEGVLVTAQVQLLVPANEKRLQVTLTTDATSYLPGDSARIDIQVVDAAGQPAPTQVSLALVDEAIFALAEDHSGSLMDAFYQPQANVVSTFDSLTPRRYGWARVEDGPTNPPSGTTTPTPTAVATPPGVETTTTDHVRRELKDTAYWNPDIRTDAAGRASILVSLPDNLTTWRITARAVTPDTEVGEAQSKLLVTQAIIVRPVLPRFAIVGDQFALSAVVQNFTGQEVAGNVRLTAPGLTVLDPGDRPVTVANNAASVARWTTVASDAGVNLVTCAFDTPAGVDAVELPLPTQPFAVPDRWFASGQVDVSASLSFTVAYNAVHEASSLTVRLSPSLALGVLDGLDALIDYPYGCVEQTMSRVLPSAVAAQTYQRLGLPNPKAAQLPEIIHEGVQRLYSFQHADGGWGWWYDDDNDVYLTAYVLFGLTMVQQAGFDVTPAVLERGFAHLDAQLTATTDPRVAAFAHYVKAAAARGDLSATRALRAQAARLDPFALAALTLALHMQGDTTAAQPLVDTLIAQAETTATTAHWPSVADAHHWRTMSSAEKNTAMALRALVGLRPTHPLAPKAIQWLMRQRMGAGWRETQATAFAVLALTDAILALGELAPDYTYAVALNGDIIATGVITPDMATRPLPPLVVPGANLRSGENTVQITRTGGEGQLYYTLAVQQQMFFDSFQPVSAATQGLKLQRVYDAPRDDGARPSSAVVYAVGDLVEVTLTLTASEDAWYVLVEDPIPAGFEVLNDRMNPTGYGDTWCGFEGPCMPGLWRNWGYNRKEVYDDHVTFFMTHLWPGQHIFTYRMRAVTPGQYSVLPAQAYPMYAEERWARSASLQVAVAPANLAVRPALVGDFDHSCRVDDFDLRQVAGAWPAALPNRDLDGSGRVDVHDLALVAARAGAACLDDAPLPGESERETQILATTTAIWAIAGQRFEVQVMAAGLKRGDSFEFALRFDPARFELIEKNWTPALADDAVLGPSVDTAAMKVRLGYLHLASVPADPLITLVFAARSSGSIDLAIVDALTVDAQGREMTTTAHFAARTQFFYLPLITR